MKSKFISRIRTISIFIGIWMVILAGCTTANTQIQPTQITLTDAGGYKEATQLAFTETIEPEPADTLLPGNTPPSPTIEAVATLSETPAMPTPRVNLEASDPASVELVSGEVQLVEFFAFW